MRKQRHRDVKYLAQGYAVYVRWKRVGCTTEQKGVPFTPQSQIQPSSVSPPLPATTARTAASRPPRLAASTLAPQSLLHPAVRERVLKLRSRRLLAALGQGGHSGEAAGHTPSGDPPSPVRPCTARPWQWGLLMFCTLDVSLAFPWSRTCCSVLFYSSHGLLEMSKVLSRPWNPPPDGNVLALQLRPLTTPLCPPTCSSLNPPFLPTSGPWLSLSPDHSTFPMTKHCSRAKSSSHDTSPLKPSPAPAGGIHLSLPLIPVPLGCQPC